MNEQKQLVEVGKVYDAHGIRGDLYVLVFSGDVSWADKVKSLCIGDEQIEIKKIKPFKRGFIVTLNGFNDRNKAELYINKSVSVPSDIFVSADGESLYLSEILGFTVTDQTLGDCGVINNFSSNGSQDLLVLEKSEKQYEIPFVKQFVLAIDYQNKTIKMDLPEGLLDINEKDL